MEGGIEMQDVKITLKAARINKNLTGEQAAKALGISYATLRVWEKNPEKIRMGWRKAISEVYEMPEECILFAKN
jgi:DNA-binding XRE family transcriptional regulator